MAIWIEAEGMMRVSLGATENQEASPHVVIDAVVAPQDESGPCRSVRPLELPLGSISIKAKDKTRRAPSLIHARQAGDG